MTSKKLAQRCAELADNKKGEKILVLDVRQVSPVTDYFVLVSGTSEPHLRAIVAEITSRLREEDDLRPTRVDGATGGQWVVLDFFDVIVHVMHTEVRTRYDLESLWGDAARVKPAAPRKPRAKKPAAS